jgi:hypothetical protein
MLLADSVSVSGDLTPPIWSAVDQPLMVYSAFCLYFVRRGTESTKMSCNNHAEDLRRTRISIDVAALDLPPAESASDSLAKRRHSVWPRINFS